MERLGRKCTKSAQRIMTFMNDAKNNSNAVSSRCSVQTQECIKHMRSTQFHTQTRTNTHAHTHTHLPASLRVGPVLLRSGFVCQGLLINKRSLGNWNIIASGTLRDQCQCEGQNTSNTRKPVPSETNSPTTVASWSAKETKIHVTRSKQAQILRDKSSRTSSASKR